jgi:hypothetical protein
MGIQNLEEYRYLCQSYLQQSGHQYKWIYWECMPEHLIDISHTVQSGYYPLIRWVDEIKLTILLLTSLCTTVKETGFKM